MATIRLTAAQALTRMMATTHIEVDGSSRPYFAGVWAIFGHGNVAGLGEALAGVAKSLPTLRAHNEQAMAHAAIAFTKQSRRKRVMACTSSIGPGATNMVTAAAVAHVNRLPVLFLPGDVYASRRPDPVLQQVEDFADATVSANDCFRPVSRFFDRITRPEQVIAAYGHALRVLTDPASCGPVTLAFCQDVQAEAYDYPAALFEERMLAIRRPMPDARELATAVDLLRAATRPLIVAGGGVLYSEAETALVAFARAHGIPVAETQAGKSAFPATDPLSLGAIGVTGTSAANACAREADVVLAVGTRLQDFTTGSRTLFEACERRLIGLNVQTFDAVKHRAAPLVADARAGLGALSAALAGWRAPDVWVTAAATRRAASAEERALALAPTNAPLATDAQVIGAVQRQARPSDIVVGAAGGLPGELHKLWEAGAPGGYHLEYGYSCMGYEIAGGLGVKMAAPEREVFVLVGDGSYLMMNSEIATSIMLGHKLVIVVLDNRGFGCIDRLQRATGQASFNNLLATAAHATLPEIDFGLHATSLGARAETVAGIAELEEALGRARAEPKTSVIVIATDPATGTAAGGHWWDVAVAEVSDNAGVRAARARYDAARRAQRLAD